MNYDDRTNLEGSSGHNGGSQLKAGYPAGTNSGSTTMMENEQGMSGNGAAAPSASGRHDYRDDLRDLLDAAHSERGLTRYRLCKQMGIDSGTLSNVLAKRRHFSLEKLEQILGLLGYRLSFSPIEGGAPTIV